MSAKFSIGTGVVLGAGVRIGEGSVIRAYTNVGRGSVLDERAIIGENSIIGEDVHIGTRVHIGRSALIMPEARICPNDVMVNSTDARTLRERVTIGTGVVLHDEVELGMDAVVPTQDTITHIGHFGTKNRVVTIYGSCSGPRYSIGCQVGVDFAKIKENILTNSNTTTRSASTYVPFLPVFSHVGSIVQASYDQQGPYIQELMAMRAAYHI